MKITAEVRVSSKGGRFSRSSKETIEIGDGFSREEIEAELRKVNEAANQKLKKMRMNSEMTLIEIEGKPV